MAVPAGPPAVFGVLADPAQYDRWQAWHAGWPRGVPAPVEGEHFVQRTRLAGRTVDVTWRVAELRAPMRMALEGEGGGMRMVWTYDLEATERGALLRTRCELHGGPIASTTLLRSRVRRRDQLLLDESLGNLQALVFEAVRPHVPARRPSRLLAPLGALMTVSKVTVAVAHPGRLQGLFRRIRGRR